MPKTVELSPAKVHFSFGPHLPDDVEKLPAIKAEAASFFQTPPARNIYYREDMGTSSTFYNAVRKFYRQTESYIDSYVLATGLMFNKVVLDPYTLEMQKDALLTTTLLNTGDPVRDQALYIGVFNRHEMVMLDELRNELTPDNKKFEMIAEEDAPAVADRLRQSFMDESRKTQATARLIEEGDLNGAMPLYQEAIRARFSTTDQRNRAYVGKIGHLVRDARKKKQPVNIFVRIGHAHAPLTELVQAVPGYFNSQIEVSSSFDHDATLLPVDKMMLTKQLDPAFTPDPDQWIVALYGTLVDSVLHGDHERQERQTILDKVLAKSSAEELTNHLRSFTPTTFMSKFRGFIAAKTT